MIENKKARELHTELSQLREDTPELESCDLEEPAVQAWLGQLRDAVNDTGGSEEANALEIHVQNLRRSILRNAKARAIRGIIDRNLERLDRNLAS